MRKCKSIAIFSSFFIFSMVHAYGVPPLKKIAYPSTIYNPKTVQTVEGTVTKVEYIKRPAQRELGVHVGLQTAKDNFTVHLGPEWYLKEQGVTLIKGDQIEVTGSKIAMKATPTIIASKITKNGQEVQLRDSRGIPMWAGRRYQK